MEHPNFEKKGIYEYNSEEEAIKKIVDYYIKLRGGKDSPTKEFFDVPVGISFKEFNKYIKNQYCAIFRKLKRTRELDRKARRNNQIDFMGNFVETFLKDISENFEIDIDN